VHAASPRDLPSKHKIEDRQRNYFVCFGETLRCIEQAGGKADRARALLVAKLSARARASEEPGER
jgi:hypothetical protein